MLPLMLAIGCGSGPLGPSPAPRPRESAAPPLGTETETETAESESGGTSPGETGIDVVPPFPAEGACHLALECPRAIPDEPGVLCALTVTSDTGAVAFDGRAVVELRGRSSSAFPKPQYGVELVDADGAETSANLSGFGAESDWVFNGAYIDRAFIRNKVVYDAFREWRPSNWAPESAFCWLDATVAGVASPMGIYLLTERIKRDDDRVALPEDPGDGSSFLLKLDDEGGLIANAGGTGTWQVVYPKDDVRTVDQTNGILGVMEAWQRAYTGPAPADPKTGVLSSVDLSSAVDFVLVEEFSRNNDGYYLSVHLSHERGGRLRFIPWDADLTFSQPSYNDNENPEGWIAYRPPFVAAFGDVPEFRAALAARWSELRAGPLSDEAFAERLDAHEAVVRPMAEANFAIWPIEDITFGWSGENYLYAIESYDAEMERIRAWAVTRAAWMDASIADW